MSRYSNQITAAAIGTALKDGNLLLLRREKEPFIGKWCLPGGKLELGEHPSAAICREFREETGLHAAVERFCGVISEVVPGVEGDSQFLLFMFQLRITGGELLPEGTSEGALAWFPPHGLEGRVIPSDAWMIEHMLLRTDGPNLVELRSTDAESTILQTFPLRLKSLHNAP
ncbi:hypothetical protein GCM10025857_35630 [Alicyclobacillus contaminans]|uniref:NUDIX hydrolase n=1 Tax=Alicyclobacillus contaminans TaxID=392016 RepID=UPI000420E030|nr:NUDIX domain-containing protein [Alicyclobacillus contaminans]GMA52206.1 hypothetical protein GCM10025857_35630 [Alicyclobacillus contaminans]